MSTEYPRSETESVLSRITACDIPQSIYQASGPKQNKIDSHCQQLAGVVITRKDSNYPSVSEPCVGHAEVRQTFVTQVVSRDSVACDDHW